MRNLSFGAQDWDKFMAARGVEDAERKTAIERRSVKFARYKLDVIGHALEEMNVDYKEALSVRCIKLQTALRTLTDIRRDRLARLRCANTLKTLKSGSKL